MTAREVKAPNRRLVLIGAPFMEGADVEAVQRALGVDADRKYGPLTAAAVRAWKFRSGYPARAIDDQLGVTGQRVLLGLSQPPRLFAKRAEQRTSGAPAIDAFIVGRSWLLTGTDYARVSPLEGLGPIFVAAGRRQHVDPRFLVAIATQEGRLGTYLPTAKIFNTFGLGPGRGYESWEANVEAAAANLARPGGHYTEAHTIRAIGNIWAPAGADNDPDGLNNSWVKAVTRFYATLGGSHSVDALVKSAP
jgi:hypothetical protein